MSTQIGATEVIARLCELQEEVAAAVIGYAVASDCFCNPRGTFENSGDALAFIESTVRRAIKAQERTTAKELSPAEQAVVDRFESAPDPYAEPQGRQGWEESPADTCRRLGWAVGVRLSGDDGFGPIVIRLTAIGESAVLARAEVYHGETLTGQESLWELCYRDWYVVAP